VARQKRMTVDDEDYYLDLLFYHRKLRRLVAIDLKLGKFQAADKGQMELYLRWLEKYEQQKMSRNALSKCKKLVIVGYSFSPSDFSTRQLLLEALTVNNVEELVVVNPDVEVVRVAKDLCHFKSGTVWYKDLKEYLYGFAKTELGENLLLKEDAVGVPKEIPTDTTPHDLYIRCKTCGIEYSAGIRTNPKSFATSVFIGNLHRCPEGHAHSYDKVDYIMKKV
jgi:hypothetical protein